MQAPRLTVGRLYLDNNTSGYEVADNHNNEQNGEPYLAVGLIFFKKFDTDETNECTKRKRRERNTAPAKRRREFEPECPKHDDYNELEEVDTIRLAHTLRDTPTRTIACVRAMTSFSVLCFCF